MVLVLYQCRDGDGGSDGERRGEGGWMGFLHTAKMAYLPAIPPIIHLQLIFNDANMIIWVLKRRGRKKRESGKLDGIRKEKKEGHRKKDKAHIHNKNLWQILKHVWMHRWRKWEAPSRRRYGISQVRVELFIWLNSEQ